MKLTTLLFLRKDDQILLAMKKRGFGVGRWNGVGGKVTPDETIEDAAKRECQEEIGVTPHDLQKVAELTFIFPDGEAVTLTHVYLTSSWEGEPIETEEMRPQWFSVKDIPYDTMWQDDKIWLPRIIQGETVKATFCFDEEDNMYPEKTELTPVSSFN